MKHFAKFNGDVHVAACNGKPAEELTEKKSQVECKKCLKTMAFKGKK